MGDFSQDRLAKAALLPAPTDVLLHVLRRTLPASLRESQGSPTTDWDNADKGDGIRPREGHEGAGGPRMHSEAEVERGEGASHVRRQSAGEMRDRRANSHDLHDENMSVHDTARQQAFIAYERVFFAIVLTNVVCNGS